MSQGYWKTHAAAWPVTSLSLGSQTYSQPELLAILGQPVVGDASLILSRQLIAAKLNRANGSDATVITATITSADSLLSAFSGRLPYMVKPSSSMGQAMTTLAARLNHYNSGPECPARG